MRENFGKYILNAEHLEIIRIDICVIIELVYQNENTLFHNLNKNGWSKSEQTLEK